MVLTSYRRFGICILALLTIVWAGCSSPVSDPIKPKGDQTSKTDDNHDDHEHMSSAHGGRIISIGRDSYHAEVVFEKGGILRLYMLGRNEASVLEVEAQPLTGYVKIDGDMEAESFVLSPHPQPGDKAGMTSLFIAHLAKQFAGKKVDITIPAIRIGSERFRVAFKSAEASKDHDMPTSISDEEEKKLYLTPGGKYTAEDIRLNGGQVASVKFKGIKPTHDVKPQSGDRICPISMTKSNPKFSWIIGGQVYEFCCPPCIDEFLALAKEKPEEVQPPEHYRKK